MIEIIPNWHPFLVHFTIALFSVSVGMFVMSKSADGTQRGIYYLVSAKLNLWIGAGFSVFTGVAGYFAYNSVAHDTASHTAMTDHRNWAIATLLVFAVLTAWTIYQQRIRSQVSMVYILIAVIGLGLVLTTGYKGAETVYRYGLGVMSLPKAEGDGHNHDHGPHGHNDNFKNSDNMAIPDDMLLLDDMNSEKDGHHDDGHNHKH